VELMRCSRVSRLPVVKSDRRVGVITERDFMKVAAELLADHFNEE